MRSGGTCSSTAFSLAICGDAPVERQLITNPKCERIGRTSSVILEKRLPG